MTIAAWPGAAQLWVRARGAAGRAVRAAKHRADRFAHPFRRRRALTQLAALRPARILVICYGNICRSPYAAEMLKKTLGPDAGVDVVSAGLYGPDRPSPDRAIEAAAQLGVDLLPHRSQLVSAELLERSDLVLVMDASHYRALRSDFGVPASNIFFLGDFDPDVDGTREVPDPYGKPLPTFAACYERLNRCIAAFAARLDPPHPFRPS